MITTMADIQKNGKCHLEYVRSTQEWCIGRPDGKIESFPAGEEGKRAAQLSALTHDVPLVAFEIESLMQRYPNDLALHRRLIRAGFIIRDTPPVLLHKNHFMVQSASDPGKKYVVNWFGDRFGDRARCGCEDWFQGNGHHQYSFEKPGAPFVDGLGVACKHLLAAWLYQRVTPMYTCPACKGECCTLEPREHPVQGWPTICKPCDVCEAKGVIFDREIMEVGPMPTQESVYA